MAAQYAHSELQRACQEGTALLEKLNSVCKRKYGSCGPLSSFYVGNCKAVIFSWSSKGGLVAGYRGGHAFVLAKLVQTAPNEPARWSAPLFLSLHLGEVGLLVGYERVESFMVAMSNKALAQLMEGRHTVLGVDQSMVAFSPQIENKSDIIASASVASDIISVSHASGFMLDFSFATGSIAINTSKNRAVFGENATPQAILNGTVPLPPELEPLYKTLNDMVECGKSPCPSRVSASLERMTAGYDPDRRVVVVSDEGPVPYSVAPET